MDRTDANQRDPAINPGNGRRQRQGVRCGGDAGCWRLPPWRVITASTSTAATTIWTPGEQVPSPASLVTWLRNSGLVAKANHLAWPQLMRLATSSSGGQISPVALLFT